MTKLVHHECTGCRKLVGQEKAKWLVIPVLVGSATGILVKFRNRPLCGSCYDDYYYALHEDWDAQRPYKPVRGGSPLPPSEPPRED